MKIPLNFLLKCMSQKWHPFSTLLNRSQMLTTSFISQWVRESSAIWSISGTNLWSRNSLWKIILIMISTSLYLRNVGIFKLSLSSCFNSCRKSFQWNAKRGAWLFKILRILSSSWCKHMKTLLNSVLTPVSCESRWTGKREKRWKSNTFKRLKNWIMRWRRKIWESIKWRNRLLI